MKVDNFNDLMALAISHCKSSTDYFYVMLSGYTDIEQLPPDSEEVAYTYYNNIGRLMKVHINAEHELVENEHNISYLLIHELLHNLLGHFTRKIVSNKFKENPQVTNIIMDAHINTIIAEEISKKSPQISMKNGWNFLEIEKLAIKEKIKWTYDSQKLYQPIEDWIVELDWLYKLSKDGKDGDDKQESDGNGQPDIQDHSEHFNNPSNQDTTEHDAKEASMKDMLDEVEQKVKEKQSSKDAGNGGDDFLRKIQKSLRKPKPTVIVPRIMSSLSECVRQSQMSTYTQHNYLSDVYGYKKKRILNKKLPKVIVAGDTSGSVGDKEIELIYQTIGKIKDADIDFIPWSSHEIKQNQVMKKIDYKSILKLHTDGGTDISTLFEFIENNYKRNVMVIVVTDMYWSAPDTIPENVKGMWFFDTEAGNNNDGDVKKYKNMLKHYKYKKIIEMI
jgi:predicted metal-dependent peptidase